MPQRGMYDQSLILSLDLLHCNALYMPQMYFQELHQELGDEFIEEYGINPDDVMDEIYVHAVASVLLSSYSTFLLKHLDHPYVHNLVYDSFMKFFTRNIASYDYKEQNFAVVGSVACKFESILKEVAKDFGVEIQKIIPSSMPGLIEYHSESN